MENKIKTGGVDWHGFRKTLESGEFHNVYQMVDGWGDIDAVKLVVMILCEALERLGEAEK